MERFISVLFHSSIQSHIAHLQTKSYAKHIALNEYYDKIVDKIDELAEAYQGKYGIISGYKVPSSKDVDSDDAVIKYFERLNNFIVAKRKKLPQDTNLQAIVDEIELLVNKTLYKLKFLK